jgi:hypothetical protein
VLIAGELFSVLLNEIYWVNPFKPGERGNEERKDLINP